MMLVRDSGDSVSHQLYKTADLRLQIRMAGIEHLNNNPERFVESMVDNRCQNYTQQMSKPETWCDNDPGSIQCFQLTQTHSTNP